MSLMKAAELWHSGQSSYLYSVLSLGRFYDLEYAEGALDELRDALAAILRDDVSEQDEDEHWHDVDLLEGAIEEVEAWLLEELEGTMAD